MVERKSTASTLFAFLGAALLAAGIGIAAMSYLSYRQNAPIAQLDLPGAELPPPPDIDMPNMPAPQTPPRADS